MQPSDSASYETSPGKHDGGEGVQDIKHEARRQAGEVAEETRRRGKAAAERQKRVIADQAVAVAGALRRAGDELDNQNQPYLASFAGRFAESVERMAGTMREKDVDSLIDQTQDFARRRPAVFIGGAVATGFLLARFLKSSDQYRGGPDQRRAAHSRGDSGRYRPHQESTPAVATGEVAAAAPETPAAHEVQHHAQPH